MRVQLESTVREHSLRVKFESTVREYIDCTESTRLMAVGLVISFLSLFSIQYANSGFYSSLYRSVDLSVD